MTYYKKSHTIHLQIVIHWLKNTFWRNSMDTVLQNDAVIRENAVDTANPAYQAYQILMFGFTVAPIVAGVDKFLHLLVNWDQYLPPIVNRMLGGHGHEFMYVVGVIEIVAGIGVFLKPKIFAYVVAAWLVAIIVNLLLIPGYFDVALRDLGLALGALALGRLSEKFSS
mgnify:CR=1 FL=1